MGNDGGSIPSRREILNFNSRNLSKTKYDTSSKELSDSKFKSSLKFCKLSNKKLTTPIVSDYKGQLFNKEAVLEYLLDKNNRKEEFKHIQSLSDIVEIYINYDEETQLITCPISGLTINLKTEGSDDLIKFELCYIVPCGCCMDKHTLDELIELKNGNKPKHDIEMECPSCNKEFNSRDIITIGGASISNTEVLRLQDKRLVELQVLRLTHSLKPQKKKNKSKKRSRDDNESSGKRPPSKKNKTT